MSQECPLSNNDNRTEVYQSNNAVELCAESDNEMDVESSVSSLTMTVTAHCENELQNNQCHDGSHPSYKEQMMETTMPSIDQHLISNEVIHDRSSFPEARTEGDESGNRQRPKQVENQHITGDQHSIPIAEAYVIRDESIDANDIHVVQLDAETAHVQSMSTLNSSQQQTVCDNVSSNSTRQTATESDDESVSYDKLRKIAADAIRVERRFWIRLVFIALLLNSLLVAGVVVGTFCSKGACSRSSPQSSALPVPSPAPSPSLAPSRWLSNNDPLSNFGVENDKFYPHQTFVDTVVATPGPFALPLPLGSASYFEDGGMANGDRHLSPGIIVLIASLAVFTESLILVGLVAYYRRWRHISM